MIGTALPFLDGIARSLRNDSCARSVAAPRSTTSISLSRSRNWVTVTPDTELFRNCASSCELMPSTRALFWSTRRRTTFDGSSQSNCTLKRSGLCSIVARTSRAIARTFAMSSPVTRNCTGKPTGGPFSSRDTRPRSAGKSVSNSRIRRARTASRSTLLFVTSTNCAKLDSTSCWSSGR